MYSLLTLSKSGYKIAFVSALTYPSLIPEGHCTNTTCYSLRQTRQKTLKQYAYKQLSSEQGTTVTFTPCSLMASRIFGETPESVIT